VNRATVLRRMRLSLVRWFSLSLLVLLPLVALARGGGGQHYSSPSHSSSSSGSRSSSSSFSGSRSSSGSSASNSSYTGGNFSGSNSGPSGLGCCLVVVIVAGLIVYAVISTRRDAKQKKQQAGREAERRTHTSMEHTQRLVAALKQTDPAFELERFHGEVKQIFQGLQTGWFHRDLSQVRPFLSDATFQRFTVQLGLMAQQGIRNAIVDLHVLNVQLIGLDQNEGFDTAHVRIHASIRDTDVPAHLSDEAAQQAAKSAEPEAFTEVWSFVRKPGAQTKAEGLSQGKCPNCGAPFNGGASNNCEFCGAIVNSGNYSWTLAEITQGIEYTREDGSGEAPGLSQMRETDAALNLQVLEDRASLLFWKWVEAKSRAEPERLAKLSTSQALSEVSRQVGQLKARGMRSAYLNCAVGAVRTRRFVREADGFDTAHVEVLWSAQVGAAPLQGPASGFEMSPQRWVFVLRRKTGATTVAKNGMSTFRCPHCNAALTDTTSPSCDYCGTLLSTGERDWVLANARPA